MTSHNDLSQIKGLRSLLDSLSLVDRPEEATQVVYPWHRYGMSPGEDFAIRYVEKACKYTTLRRLVCERFQEIGHPTTDSLADAVIVAFILMPEKQEPVATFRQVLKSFCNADVTQYVLIPAPCSVRLVHAKRPDETEVLQSFESGAFNHAPFAGRLMDTVKYRVERMGFQHTLEEIEKLSGRIAVYRGPISKEVFDFSAIGLKRSQLGSVGELVQNYYDDLAEALFDMFWEDHLRSQYDKVAAGAGVLTRERLTCLPRTAWLSLFYGPRVFSAAGALSLIQETNHKSGTLVLDVMDKRRQFTKAGAQIAEHVADMGLSVADSYPCLENYCRLLVRSRELKDRGFTEESFTLLITALESLLSDQEYISTTVSRRVAALVSLTESSPFLTEAQETKRLYNLRSLFVHAGQAINAADYQSLNRVCTSIYFSALRSQALSVKQGLDEKNWKEKWLCRLDHVASCFSVGIVVDGSVARFVGGRTFPEACSIN